MFLFRKLSFVYHNIEDICDLYGNFSTINHNPLYLIRVRRTRILRKDLNLKGNIHFIYSTTSAPSPPPSFHCNLPGSQKFSRPATLHEAWDTPVPSSCWRGRWNCVSAFAIAIRFFWNLNCEGTHVCKYSYLNLLKANKALFIVW